MKELTTKVEIDTPYCVKPCDRDHDGPYYAFFFFFFWPLYCLSFFVLRILITSLVSFVHCIEQKRRRYSELELKSNLRANFIFLI
jgi:hypothetical protein